MQKSDIQKPSEKNPVAETLSLILQTRLLIIIVFLALSYAAWRLLDGYILRGYIALIPVLFAIQIFLNDLLESYLSRQVKQKTIWFAILFAPGTILHELSHAFTALLTGCRITALSLFRPNPNTGVLGYVAYETPSDNWTVFREFVIGFAPFFGCGVMLILFSYLQNNFLSPDLVDIGSFDKISNSIIVILKNFYQQFLDLTLSSALPWVLLYLEICFGLGAAPSTIDFKGALGSIIKHPLSTLFVVLLFLLLIIIGEQPPILSKYGEILSGAIVFALKSVILILFVSISILVISFPMAFFGVRFTQVKGYYKIIPVLLFLIAYLLTFKLTLEKSISVLAAAITFAVSSTALSNPKLFLK